MRTLQADRRQSPGRLASGSRKATSLSAQVGFSINGLLVQLPTVKPVSRIAEEFHLVSNSSESSTEYRCKFSLTSALQYEIAFNLTFSDRSRFTPGHLHHRWCNIRYLPICVCAWPASAFDGGHALA